MTTIRPYQRHRSRAKAIRATTPGIISGTLATIGLCTAMMISPETIGKLPAIVAALVSLVQALTTLFATFHSDKRRHS
jgi:hypothetical protein